MLKYLPVIGQCVGFLFAFAGLTALAGWAVSLFVGGIVVALYWTAVEWVS